VLREWETSRDLAEIYNTIIRNKKVLRDRMRGHVYIRYGVCTINADNLVNLMKEVFYRLKLSNTQWKILTNMADKEKNGLVDVELFFMMLGNNAKLNKAIPK
jgi:hypothetical protein